ncbi:MAG: hypothetical protein IJ426_03045 [Clostridia bacterium]|nr:hypothetical protein [Clostridia bacterium]
MNNDELINGIGNIDEDIIAITAISRKRRSKKPLIIKFVAVAAALCMVFGIAYFVPGLRDDLGGIAPYPLTALAIEAEYPEMPQYPSEELAETDWDSYYEQWQEWNEYRSDVCGYPTQRQMRGLDKFFADTAPAILSDTNGENALYSPVNIYFALSMLAETTGGESREQILSLLGSESVEELRDTVNNLWLANYRDDGITKAVFANSMWLRGDYDYKLDTLKTLKEKYYASSYSGTMGAPEYNEALKKWLNDQTGGLLKDSVENLKGFNNDTVIGLASTIYLKASWHDKFRSVYNTKEKFRSPTGDIECEFMNDSSMGSYYMGNGFTATYKSLNDYGGMYFILPDEGSSPEELISEGFVLDFIANPTCIRNDLLVNLKVPKFDVKSDMSLIEMLEGLGVTDVFSLESDMSPLTDEFVYVSSCDHSARVKINEDGCEAAAFTVIIADAGSSMPKDEVDFFLDRPFIFAVTSPIGTPLFVGIVNNP